MPLLSGREKHCVLTEDYKSFGTHQQRCLFQDICRKSQLLPPFVRSTHSSSLVLSLTGSHSYITMCVLLSSLALLTSRNGSSHLMDPEKPKPPAQCAESYEVSGSGLELRTPFRALSTTSFGLLCWWDKEEIWEKTVIKWPGTGLSTRHKRFHLSPTTRKFSHHAHVMDEKQSPREDT